MVQKLIILYNNKMKTLSQIIDFYGSDKNLSNYTEKYTEIFENIRNKKFSMLEIGIGTIIPTAESSMINTRIPNYKPGASLRSWQEYFPNVMVYGGDIQPDTQFTDTRIKTFLFNSTIKTECDFALRNLSFKIIIDDGLHTSDAQLATFDNLYFRLESGGIYIIEDITQMDLYDRIESKLNGEETWKSPIGNLFFIFKK